MENQGQSKSVVPVREWVITLIIAAIPIIGIIMLFVWGFSSATNENKANFAKGALIVYAIIIGLYIVYKLLIGAAILNSLNNM